MRLGIIKLSSLGDIVVAMSFLPALKERGYGIDWFIDSAFEDIAQHSPYLNQIISLPIKVSAKNKDYKTLLSIPAKLKGLEKYDLLIDMQGLLKSALIGKMIKTNTFRGFGFGSCKESIASLFYTQKVSIGYEENILKRNATLLSLPLPIPPINAFGYTQQAQEKILPLLQTSNKKVLLLLEASKPTKMYPIFQFMTLIQALKAEKITFFVLHHSHRDQAEEICSKTQAILLPKLNLDEIKTLIANMDAVIGGDTGITHLAWAMNKPSITLYGNTPLKRFQLSGDKNISLSGNPCANYDKNDFSIGKIDPLEIKKHLLDIL